MSAVVPYLDGLRSLDLAQLPGDTGVRRQALNAALELGLPDRHVEAWKYSAPTQLAAQALPLATGAALTRADIDMLDWDGEAVLLVLVDGTLDSDLSRLDALPAGVHVEAQQATLAGSPSDELRADRARVFTLINRALQSGGIELRIDSGVTLTSPIHLLYLHSGRGQAHVGTSIQLANNSQAQVVEHFAGLQPVAGSEAQDAALYLCNTCTRIELADGAQLQHTRIQAHANSGFHVGDLQAHLGRDSTLHARNFDFSAAWSRHNAYIALDAPGASVHMDGVYLGFDHQHVDNHSFIDHRVPHCTSRERYRGILGGKARGVFNGMIMVRKDAQKTDSDLHSAALLLGKGAEVDAKPELEIYADDVKCSHGATVGQLDETAVFYLRSRGIDESQARAMLTFSFAEELINEVQPASLRRYLENTLLAQLPDSRNLEELLA